MGTLYAVTLGQSPGVAPTYTYVSGWTLISATGFVDRKPSRPFSSFQHLPPRRYKTRACNSKERQKVQNQSPRSDPHSDDGDHSLLHIRKPPLGSGHRTKRATSCITWREKGKAWWLGNQKKSIIFQHLLSISSPKNTQVARPSNISPTEPGLCRTLPHPTGPPVWPIGQQALHWQVRQEAQEAHGRCYCPEPVDLGHWDEIRVRCHQFLPHFEATWYGCVWKCWLNPEKPNGFADHYPY